jgi:hypothetical protein
VGNARAVWSVVVGVLGLVALPVAVFATRYSKSYDLVHAGLAIPVALGLGVEALVLARQARAREAATLGRAGGLRAAGVGRALGVAAISVGLAGLVALSVYGLLDYVGRSG